MKGFWNIKKAGGGGLLMVLWQWGEGGSDLLMGFTAFHTEKTSVCDKNLPHTRRTIRAHISPGSGLHNDLVSELGETASRWLCGEILYPSLNCAACTFYRTMFTDS